MEIFTTQNLFFFSCFVRFHKKEKEENGDYLFIASSTTLVESELSVVWNILQTVDSMNHLLYSMLTVSNMSIANIIYSKKRLEFQKQYRARPNECSNWLQIVRA